jgi:hypothetical protein
MHMISRLTYRLRVAALAAAVALVGVAPAMAEQQQIGTFNDWQAFVIREGGNTTCFVASKPKKDEGDYTSRGDIFAMVTARPAANVTNEVSIVAGYVFKDGSDVEIVVDGDKKFTLFTKGGNAWARDKATDNALVAAMKKGRSMVVRGTSSRGTATRDTYSLSGITAALNRIAATCGNG